jgi:hypothetical protein
MKRSPQLAALSRDHHLALEAALRLRRASPGDEAEAVAYFLAFWEGHGERHFAIEEALVLPALPGTDDAWAEGARRVRRDHEEIRGRASDLSEGRGAEAARELGELLRDHVRFEERQLFPLLEARLTADALTALGRAIDAAERAG